MCVAHFWSHSLESSSFPLDGYIVQVELMKHVIEEWLFRSGLDIGLVTRPTLSHLLDSSRSCPALLSKKSPLIGHCGHCWLSWKIFWIYGMPRSSRIVDNILMARRKGVVLINEFLYSLDRVNMFHFKGKVDGNVFHLNANFIGDYLWGPEERDTTYFENVCTSSFLNPSTPRMKWWEPYSRKE